MLTGSAVMAGSAAAAQVEEHRVRRANAPTRPDPPAQSLSAPGSQLFRLHADIKDFTGRDHECRTASTLLGSHTATTTNVVVVSGKGGIGKTTFAVHVAHQVQDCFPDGQLFVSLKRDDQSPLDVREILADLLGALGAARAAVPEGIEERARLFRALLAGQRMLIVLDDAAEETQIRPLLPDSVGCAVIITRRAPLAGLANAHYINLVELDPAQATDLLSGVVGPERVASEPDAAAEIVKLCGYLPLAVRIGGTKLAYKHHWHLATFAERMRDERHRLAELSAGDLEVRASIAISYNGLSDTERLLFRLLGLLDVTDFSAWAGAALLNTDLVSAEQLIERLVDMQLLTASYSRAADNVRYRFHDLLRVFARERLREEETADTQRDALARMLDVFIALTEHASSAIEQGDVSKPELSQFHWPDASDDRLAAILRQPDRWFAVERVNLVAMVEQACAAVDADDSVTHLRPRACRLAVALYGSFHVGAHWHEWRRMYEAVLETAEQLGDPMVEAEICLRLGDVYKNSGRVDGPEGIPEPDREDVLATIWLEKSRTLFHQLGNRRMEVAALRRLAGVYRDLGDVVRAERHYTAALTQLTGLPDADLPRSYVMRGYGCLQRLTNRCDDAAGSFLEALSYFRGYGDRGGELGALRGLGETYLRLARWELAEECFQKHLEDDRRSGDRHAQAHSLHGLARVRIGQGNHRDAVPYLHEALPIFEEIGHRASRAVALADLGQVCAALGRRRAARHHWTESAEVYRFLALPSQADTIDTLIARSYRVPALHATAQIVRRIMWRSTTSGPS